ncbi:MAG: glycosyltransferase family 2 protein [Candidatus Levyibacteriota bacterium]
MIDLSIIIVSYNTKSFLKNCISSAFNQRPKGLNMEVIVVDNGSTDGSVQLLENEFPNIKLIKNKENFGFSKANNIGVKKAEGRYLLFLNSDTVIYEKVFETMVKFMDEHKDAGAATCKVILPSGLLDDASHRGFPTPWNSFSHFSNLSKIFPKTKIFGGYNLSWMNLEKTHQIDACCGAFIIVRRKAGDEIEWWDEDYFWYGEDLDFCYKLKEKGWKVYFVPQVSVLHYKGVSGGIKSISKHLTNATKETKIKATKARFQAMRIFYKKHYEKVYPKIVSNLVSLGISLKEKSVLQ